MMFEPDAESMPAEQRAGVQEERLRVLVDRLLAAGGFRRSGSGRPGLPRAAVWACPICPGCR